MHTYKNIFIYNQHKLCLTEIGIANILIGILLIFSFYFDNQWILAGIVASTIWGWGNALGHIISYKKTKNKKSGNVGWALYLDIFLPLISIILYTRLSVFELFFVYAIAGVKVILRATIQERHSRAKR